MIGLLTIGKLIEPAEFENYINEAEKLETVVHKYGREFVIPDYPCWMEYKNDTSIKGSISFSRHTYSHPLLSKMIDDVVRILTPVFPESAPPNPLRVHLIRTIGNVPMHRDEAGRMTCINIGLRNTSGAITNVSVDNISSNFNDNHESAILEDGYAYLLDTYRYHSVTKLNENPRYLITYGLATMFDESRMSLRLPS